jgi:Tol biopolymer transport system component
LDFGLAKPTAAILGARAVSDKGQLTPSTPTMNFSALSASPGKLTQQGTIVGTFQYMAPEVLQGQEADARSDIFSFGAVLYEMLTGKHAFEGKSQISVASAILEKDPEPITKIQPMAPIGLDHVVLECLAKDPDSRWQNAADIARELRWIGSGSSGVSPVPLVKLRHHFRERLLWAAGMALLLAILAWSIFRQGEPARALRSYLPPPPDAGFDFTGDLSGPPVITPDGMAIAFCARTQKDPDSIWVQSLGELAAKKLEGTVGASFPFWSADGKFIGFFADGHLKKIPTAGGPVTDLAEASNPRGGSWNKDNVIIYEPDYRDTLWRINAMGGTPVRLTKFEAGKHTTHRWPRFLPDGKHFLFFATNHSGGSEQGIYFGSLEDGSYKHVLAADSDAQYASGYLLYHLQSELLAQKFDPTTGVLSGDAVPVANMVEYDSGTWHTTFAASQNGLLIYEPGSKILGTDLLWLDHTGKTLRQVAERAFYKGSGQLSPDGKRLATSVGDPQADIWVFDLVRGTRTRLTFGGATYLMPSWSADGQRVIYVRQNGTTLVAGTSLRARLANGGGQEEVLMEGDPSEQSRTLTMPQLSSDGRYLVHMEQNGPIAGVWAMPVTGDKKPFPIVQPQSQQSRIVQFRLSPDGRWLAYSCTESGREEVYVTHFPSGAGRWQISQAGGTFPAWRADGKEIYFAGIDSLLHAATVNPKSEEFEFYPVRTLFQVNYVNPIGTPYDVAPDGQHFVFATYPGSLATPLVLVTNWTVDLRK